MKDETLWLRRTMPSNNNDIFSDEVKITSSPGLPITKRMCKLIAAFAYGDKLSQGDRVLVSSETLTTIIDIDYTSIALED